MKINKPGLWGEIFAARYLRDGGYEIIAANYRKRVGEIDIVAKKNGIIAFVEVKTRGERFLALPMESVDYKKQQKIRAAASAYLKETGSLCLSRFDVIEVYLNSDLKPLKINHIEDAF